MSDAPVRQGCLLRTEVPRRPMKRTGRYLSQRGGTVETRRYRRGGGGRATAEADQECGCRGMFLPAAVVALARQQGDAAENEVPLWRMTIMCCRSLTRLLVTRSSSDEKTVYEVNDKSKKAWRFLSRPVTSPRPTKRHCEDVFAQSASRPRHFLWARCRGSGQGGRGSLQLGFLLVNFFINRLRFRGSRRGSQGPRHLLVHHEKILQMRYFGV